MERTTGEHRRDPYEVRLFEPGDRAGYLDLYETVFGGGSDEWFEWKYGDNPYTDHVAVAVALADGEVVGAKSQMGFEMAHRGRRFVALQPGDTMVHPDHRRRGLYSRLTELVAAEYADREVGLLFNYPNEATLAGSRKHGWAVVGPVTTRYRVQDPAALAGINAGPFQDVLESASEAVASGVHRLHDGSNPAPDGVTVTRHRTVPVDTLAALYRRAVPSRLHAVRDETYLSWRFDNPKWRYTAFTAARDGEAVCGAVVGRTETDGPDRAALTTVLPLGARAPPDATRALLSRIVGAYRDATSLTVADDAVRDSTASRFGFLPDTAPPLSWMASPDVLVAYPLTDDLAREEVATQENWTLGLDDRDTR